MSEFFLGKHHRLDNFFMIRLENERKVGRANVGACWVCEEGSEVRHGRWISKRLKIEHHSLDWRVGLLRRNFVINTNEWSLVATYSLTFLSYWKAILFLRKSPWQIVARGSRGCRASFEYSQQRSERSSIFFKKSSGMIRLSSSFSRIACVPRFGETFMVAPQIRSGSWE